MKMELNARQKNILIPTEIDESEKRISESFLRPYDLVERE